MSDSKPTDGETEEARSSGAKRAYHTNRLPQRIYRRSCYKNGWGDLIRVARWPPCVRAFPASMRYFCLGASRPMP